MKRTPLFLILLFLVSGLFAQNNNSNNTGKISGKVIDAISKVPVDYATVGIYKQGTASPFNGASTDPKGNFKIDKVAAGEYTIKVDFLGYKQLVVEHLVISNTVKSLSLGNIVLSPVQNQLSGVVIKATAPTVENKIDKLVYNPANDLTAQGGVATDVLRKVPMVTVDIDGNVELMGNANVRFLINGKPSSIFGASLTDALQAIPASQIKSIEVITSPGAKYDAEGTGGIINIILKDSKVQGINGSVNLSAGTRLENGSFNLNARKGNFGVNAFFSGNEQLNSTAITTTNRTSYSNTRDTITRLYQKGSSAFRRSGYQSGISFNWSISPKDELTAAVNFNHFGNHGGGITNLDQSTFSTLTNLTVDTLSRTNSNSRFSANSTDWSLAYKKTFSKEGQELDVLYNASYGNNVNNYSLEQDYITSGIASTGSLSNNPGKDKETDIAVDYTQPFAKDFTVETGAKAVIENLNNSVVTETLSNGGYVPNPFQTYGFNYKRIVFAYYLSSSFSLFNFIDGKAGLRYEHTSSTSDFPNTVIPSYGIFAPSFVLSHKLDKTETIKFSYSYRLERPEYRDLNPFYNISDPHNISTGNPNLKPELGHNFELGYNKSFDGGANIYLAGFYRYNTNDIQSFTTFYQSLRVGDSTYTNVSLNQRYNIGKETTTGINIFGSLPVTGKLSLRSNMFFADRITNNPGSPQVSGFAYRINLNGSYQLADDLAAEFFVNYRSSQKGIQGTNPAFAFYNIAVRKQFMNKKASIGLTAANPFSQYINQKQTTFGSNFDQTTIRQVPFRSFGISISYKFGKLEFKKDKEKDDNGQQVPGDNGG
ncbi:TonB-dependent receptor family protein [Mucilaginibacter sp. BJC16-A38]|uniref:outer membrane beta-barrel family protein n=1 Tax=Mucilaginibacter phenanthrenivorans TaxID=1234842 RepID=UPI0021588E21|nr:outer membrane beta-barrel family protein [Mucilaginibacter phenanthrenivorans]MCR8561011.1 TonB-dependent receptor family protein [Mucilaginibacter phenanthrenivorans]